MSPFQQVEALARQHGYRSYTDYLRSDHWRGLKQAMNLYFSPCCVCPDRANVPHHIRYKNLIDVTVDDLAPMCMKCHDDFHLACRKMSLDYIGMEPAQIFHTVRAFRLTPFYIKREAKLSRRAAGIKIRQAVKSKDSKRTIRIQFRQFLRGTPTRKKAESLCAWLLNTFPKPT